MKQVAVVSGKGGTGKTTVVAALARLVPNKVLVDADVDAANLAIVTAAQPLEQKTFTEGAVAQIDQSACIRCDLCRTYCRFGAVAVADNQYEIDPHACEGCKVCQLVCPKDAVKMTPTQAGTVIKSKTPFGTLWHGKLSPGRENSGKLVTHLRELAIEEANASGADFVIIDGAPGIGCQVIASVTGVDAAIVVTEPTLTALHDLQRIAGLLAHFRIPAVVAINKFDVNESLAASIVRWCSQNELSVAVKIPLDVRIIHALAEGRSPVEIGDRALVEKYAAIWRAVEDLLS